MSPKVLNMILMGDLKARLGDPRDEREEDLVMALADQGLVNITDHILPRRQYQGAVSCTCSMQRDGIHIMGRGYYILSTDKRSFVNVGLQETRHGTDHRLILAVLRLEGALCNCCYRQGQTKWPIRLKSVRPQTEGGAAQR